MKILITENQLRILTEQKVTVDSIADGLWSSTEGLGTDEENFYLFLGKIKNKSVFDSVNNTLKTKYGENFYDIVNDYLEFSDEEKNTIVNILNRNKIYHSLSKDGKITPKETGGFKDPLTLSPSENLYEFLKYEEGDPKKKGEPVLTSYKKTGDVWTIGYGHTRNVKPKTSITRETAIKFLKEDVKEFENCVKKIFRDWSAKGINVDITQSMFDALVSLAYNTGCGSLRGTSATDEIIDHVKRKEFYEASQKIKSFKLRSGFAGLISRREKESKMFCKDGGCTKSGIT